MFHKSCRELLFIPTFYLGNSQGNLSACVTQMNELTPAEGPRRGGCSELVRDGGGEEGEH